MTLEEIEAVLGSDVVSETQKVLTRLYVDSRSGRIASNAEGQVAFEELLIILLAASIIDPANMLQVRRRVDLCSARLNEIVNAAIRLDTKSVVSLTRH